ncbi:MAG: DUF305 domain-containing protein [Firmicutes bacterium]|nr:DUF305 domain-containing protein [[Eubacterium] siraeum]MCM1488811.1 DUF305 domain-containing protein [Bacillota bacterium]
MQGQCSISCVAKNYLSEYYCILEKMIGGMTGAELTDSISGNFIAQMLPHHRAAIEMSENILRYTTLIPLERIAQSIIAEQTQSIENMCKIQSCCGEMCDQRSDVCLYQRKVNQITQSMFAQMRSAKCNNNINCDFMREMIPHHLGAVRMSENALQYNICPQLVPILRSIIASQKKGIGEMQCLMRQIGCK